MAYLIFLSSADGNKENVNKAVSIFVETIRKAADPLFQRQSICKCVPQKLSEEIPVWANEEFHFKKKRFYKCRDKQRKHPSDGNRSAMIYRLVVNISQHVTSRGATMKRNKPNNYGTPN